MESIPVRQPYSYSDCSKIPALVQSRFETLLRIVCGVHCHAYWRHRRPYTCNLFFSSDADLNFSIPDPESTVKKSTRSRINKEFNYDPDVFLIPDPDIFHPWSRDQKSTGSQIRILRLDLMGFFLVCEKLCGPCLSEQMVLMATTFWQALHFSIPVLLSSQLSSSSSSRVPSPIRPPCAHH
jgi:hypothetical protein